MLPAQQAEARSTTNTTNPMEGARASALRAARDIQDLTLELEMHTAVPFTLRLRQVQEHHLKAQAPMELK